MYWDAPGTPAQTCGFGPVQALPIGLVLFEVNREGLTAKTATLTGVRRSAGIVTDAGEKPAIFPGDR
jgi:hypothetical protein